MPFQGTFDVLDFAEVLRLLARQEMTGKLHVRSRSMGANLLLENGQLVGADQSEHSPTATVGDVQSRVEEVCFELLDAERGAFEFHPSPPGTFTVTTKLDVGAVLDRAWQRQAEWRDIQVVIPSLDFQPRLVMELLTDSVTLDRDRWRVLTAVDGRRTLRAIGRSLGLSDFDVCRLTIGLLDDGVIELDGRGLHPLPSAPAVAVGGDAEGPRIPLVELQPPDPPDPADPGQVGDLGGMSPIDPSGDEESVVAIHPADSPGPPGDAEAPVGAGESGTAETAGSQAITTMPPAATDSGGSGSDHSPSDDQQDQSEKKPRRLVRIRSRSV